MVYILTSGKFSIFLCQTPIFTGGGGGEGRVAIEGQTNSLLRGHSWAYQRIKKAKQTEVCLMVNHIVV